MAQHDIVVIGASAGGIEALQELVSRLPPDLPAALFVVVHISPYSVSRLSQILSRAGPLPATQAVDGEPIEPGHIYVAPPDRHLLVRPGWVALSRGPRENHSRPAIDPLFRSAARAYGCPSSGWSSLERSTMAVWGFMPSRPAAGSPSSRIPGKRRSTACRAARSGSSRRTMFSPPRILRRS